MTAPDPGYCAARPDGQLAHQRPLAEVEADPALVVVPCPEHDTPGHAWAHLDLPPIETDPDKRPLAR